jgi:hypothetical protein
VVFIHGLWIHSDAWQPWVELYRSAGYNTMAPGWPGDSASVDQTRKNAAAVADKGIDDITNGYLDVISLLPAKPIVIGQDHTVPEVVARAAYKLYSGSGAVTGYHAFPDRGHSLVLDHGWREVADLTLSWLASQDL